MVEIDYFNKYLKYKHKYIELKNLLLGGVPKAESPKVKSPEVKGGIAKPESEPPKLNPVQQIRWDSLMAERITLQTNFDEIKSLLQRLPELNSNKNVIMRVKQIDRLFSKKHTEQVLKDLFNDITYIKTEIGKLKTILKIIDELNKNNLWYICALFKSKQNYALLNKFLQNIDILLAALEIDRELNYNIQSTYTKLLVLENYNLIHILQLSITMAGMPYNELIGMAIGLDLLSLRSDSELVEIDESSLLTLPTGTPTAVTPGTAAATQTPRLNEFSKIENNRDLFCGMLKTLFNEYNCEMNYEVHQPRSTNQLYYNFMVRREQLFHATFHGWEVNPIDRIKTSDGKIHIKFDTLRDPNNYSRQLTFNIYMNREGQIKFTRYYSRVPYTKENIETIKAMTNYSNTIKPILDKFSLFFNNESVIQSLLPLIEARIP